MRRARAVAVTRDINWRIFAGLLLAAAAVVALAPVARAEDDVQVDEGGDVLDLHPGRGMPATNARVAPILASYPDQYAVICVAGCIGKPHVVQLLPRPVAGRSATYVPSSGKTGDKVYGPPAPGQKLAQGGEQNDVVCVAGCNGASGQVLQRINDLAPAGKAKAAAPVKAQAKPKKYEPLEVFP